MTDNTYPVYKVDVIVQFFRTEIIETLSHSILYAFNLNTNNLCFGSQAETIQRLYMRILQMVFGLRHECLYMMPFLENVQYPSIYEGVVPVLHVYNRMCQLLPLCHMYDFSLSDLLNPKSKRTISILSAIQNFLHFRKDRLKISSAHQQSFRTDLERLQTCTREIKEAEKKIEKLTTIPPEQQVEARELAAIMADLTATTKQLYNDTTSISEKVSLCKAEIAEITQKMAKKKEEVATEKEEISKLKCQVVESPKELKDAMERMKENLKNIKVSKHNLSNKPWTFAEALCSRLMSTGDPSRAEHADERVEELQIVVQCASQVEADAQLLLKQMQELQSSMCKSDQQREESIHLMAVFRSFQLRALQPVETPLLEVVEFVHSSLRLAAIDFKIQLLLKQVQTLGAMIESLEKELKSLCSDEAQLKRALALKYDKLSKQQIRRQKRKEAKEQHLRDVYARYDKVHQKREDFVKVIEDKNLATKQLKETTQTLREQCSRRTQKAQERYDTLLTTLELFNKRIESILEETNEAASKIKSHF
ncbi:hypothetical protein DNTS_008288 [Danionella cerebrum]|uniref:Kinetochore protein Nuf2 N-terminal domain-containing protein n=1 Tax=Danionella cerebrum TaxID=2873325 RepID=A0A553R6J3_9TELE|nr:hypothetical protein DNTS_008288 [Danionella translucida]